MKQFILILSVLFLGLIIPSTQNTFAQTLQFEEIKSSGGGFDVNSGELTNETVTVDGKSYQLYKTKAGARYIKCNSPKTGNDYPVWVGTKTSHTYDGRTVYKSKKGSYSILKISSTGNPYNKWLKAK